MGESSVIEWNSIRLIDGPFDGDDGIIDELPTVLFAWRCPGCKEIHWSTGVPADLWDQVIAEGGAPYRRDARAEDGDWLYRYADPTTLWAPDETSNEMPAIGAPA